MQIDKKSAVETKVIYSAYSLIQSLGLQDAHCALRLSHRCQAHVASVWQRRDNFDIHSGKLCTWTISSQSSMLLPCGEGLVGPHMNLSISVAESKASSLCYVDMGQTYSIEYAQPQLVRVPQLHACMLGLTLPLGQPQDALQQRRIYCCHHLFPQEPMSGPTSLIAIDIAHFSLHKVSTLNANKHACTECGV